LIDSKYGIIDHGTTAIIEMTYASGIKHLSKEELDPLHASSFGTGQLIKHALDRGIQQLIITMGGSATVDGGTGILQALGFRFLDLKGQDLRFIKDMHALDSIDCSSIHPLLKHATVNVLCDVKNFICGPEGAAAVYGPQKGADAAAVTTLNEALLRLATEFENLSGKSVVELPAGGTAGGAAAALYAMMNAHLLHGIDYFLDISGFDGSLKKADLVITGEGRLDEQTMQGKAPFGVAIRAKQAGKTTACIAGSVPEHPDENMRQLFDHIIPTTPLAQARNRDLAYNNLLQTAAKAAKLLFEQS
jgi:glycerate 2-kinase